MSTTSTANIQFKFAGIQDEYTGDSIKLGDADAKRTLLFPMGAVKYRADFPGGKIEFTRKVLGAMRSNFIKEKQRHLGEGFALQLNYLHPEPGDKIENHRAAGWIVDVDVDDAGLWAHIKWNDKAKEYIRNDEFRFLSPEFSMQRNDTNTGKPQGPTLLGAALLNTPYLKELPRVAASDRAKAHKLEANNMDEMLKQFAAALGLPETATAEDMLKAIAALKSEGVEAEDKEKEVAEAKATAEAAEQKLSETKDAAVKLAAENQSLAARITKLEADAKAKAVEAWLDEAVRGGQVTPAMRDTAMKLALSDLDMAKEVYGQMKPAVQTGEVGVSTKEEDAGFNIDVKLSALRKENPDAKEHELFELLAKQDKDAIKNFYGGN